MVSGRIHSLHLCMITLMFFSAEQLQAEKCIQRYFKKRHIGASLSALHIISNHSVCCEALCSHYCLKEEICVGFNYNEVHNNVYIENCQLSKSMYDDIKKDGHGDKEWVYFEDIQTVSGDVTQSFVKYLSSANKLKFKKQRMIYHHTHGQKNRADAMTEWKWQA